jgi:hypothetical protein
MESNMNVREMGMGYIQDPHDLRDYAIQVSAPIKERTISYRDSFKKVRNQGAEGKCVGFAASAVKEFFDNRQRNTNEYFSPEFIYQECKKQDGIPHIEGTYPRTAMKVLNDMGVPREAIWRYGRPAPKNRVRTLEAALPQKIQSYARIYSVRDMIANLLLNGPFVVGVWITEGWYTDHAIKTGIVDEKYRRTSKSGGHALAVIGYDAERKMFELRNSWSDSIYDDGYNWVTKQWMSTNFTDAWSIIDDTTIDSLLVITRQTVMPGITGE